MHDENDTNSNRSLDISAEEIIFKGNSVYLIEFYFGILDSIIYFIFGIFIK